MQEPKAAERVRVERRGKLVAYESESAEMGSTGGRWSRRVQMERRRRRTASESEKKKQKKRRRRETKRELWMRKCWRHGVSGCDGCCDGRRSHCGGGDGD